MPPESRQTGPGPRPGRLLLRLPCVPGPWKKCSRRVTPDTLAHRPQACLDRSPGVLDPPKSKKHGKSKGRCDQ